MRDREAGVGAPEPRRVVDAVSWAFASCGAVRGTLAGLDVDMGDIQIVHSESGLLSYHQNVQGTFHTSYKLYDGRSPGWASGLVALWAATRGGGAPRVVAFELWGRGR